MGAGFANPSAPPALQSRLAQEKGLAFAEQKDLKGGSDRGSASLSVKNPRLALGKMFSVDIRFTNKSGGDPLLQSILQQAHTTACQVGYL